MKKSYFGYSMVIMVTVILAVVISATAVFAAEKTKFALTKVAFFCIEDQKDADKKKLDTVFKSLAMNIDTIVREAAQGFAIDIDTDEFKKNHAAYQWNFYEDQWELGRVVDGFRQFTMGLPQAYGHSIPHGSTYSWVSEARHKDGEVRLFVNIRTALSEDGRRPGFQTWMRIEMIKSGKVVGVASLIIPRSDQVTYFKSIQGIGDIKKSKEFLGYLYQVMVSNHFTVSLKSFNIIQSPFGVDTGN